MKRMIAGGLALLGAAIVSQAAAAQTECGALANLKIDNVNLLSATLVPAKDGLPEHCRVLGYVRPAINFEVRLPTQGWNGKFYMAGCGGFCGALDSDRPGFVNAMNYGLKRGYAAATTDSGHWGSSVLDARWAWNDRLAEIDWGWRGVAETTRAAKEILKAHYGEPQQKAYFVGCSTGGRQANMAAWKFPDDFDGIVSGAPALDYPGLVATFFAWVAQANAGPDGKDVLAKAKVALIQQKAVQACDAQDGVSDGLISDPRSCGFEPASLQCAAGDQADCLTAAEVKTVEKWYAGAKNGKGEQLYPGGVPVGSEPFWPLWLTGLEKGGGRLLPAFANDFLRYMAFAEDPGEGYTAAQFDFEADPQRLAPMKAIYNSDDPDLTKFKASGGKLIMYHGWADALVTPQKTVDYYEAVEAKMGGRAQTQDFLRLFMIPGFDHCGLQAGPGIDQNGFDPLSALEAWVEKGAAPESLLATKRDKDGKTLWTRPLCPYPQRAAYGGTGDPKDAASFACAE